MRLIYVIGVMLLGSSSAIGQNLWSPVVESDKSVTFQLKAQRAEKVQVNIGGKRLEMQKSAGGIWKLRTDALPAGIHEYTFYVDGTRMLDPHNRWVKKWLSCASLVEIPGSPPLMTEQQQVPHGSIHHDQYACGDGGTRPLIVYTPPGYSSSDAAQLPLLLLLHGNGDDETAWTEVGRIHMIADNLIATGKIKPVVIAMPYGHPVPLPRGKRPADYFVKNNAAYESDIVKDVLPFIEKRYRVGKTAAHRSIAGLSMGGGHALDTGLKHSELFNAIGAFSSAAPESDLAKNYPDCAGPQPQANSNLKHLWIAIGKKDFLLKRNHKFIKRLEANKVNHTYIETDGGHAWPVWRDYIERFLVLTQSP